MKFRTPRLDIPRSTYLQDTLKLFHPKMLIIIMCLTSIGHFLSPNPFNMERYILGILGVLFGVLAAYRFNEEADLTTAPSIPGTHHRATALILLIMAVSIGVYLSDKYAGWIILLAAVAVIILVVYNGLPRHPIHNKGVYAFIWGFVPLVFSEMLQSLTWPTATTLFFGSWAMVVAVSTLYLWGPVTCGRAGSCTKAKGKPNNHLCHSPFISCKGRVTIPKEIDKHMKHSINLNLISIILITMAVAAWRITL